MDRERPARRELNVAETKWGDLDVGGARGKAQRGLVRVPGPAAAVHRCLPGEETSLSSAVFAKAAVV